MENLSEALKKRLADRASAPVPIAVKGLPAKIEPVPSIVGLPPEK